MTQRMTDEQFFDAAMLAMATGLSVPVPRHERNQGWPSQSAFAEDVAEAAAALLVARCRLTVFERVADMDEAASE